MDSLEVETLSAYQEDLQNATVDPTPLAVSLCAKGFISSHVRQRVTATGAGLVIQDKAAILFDAVEKKIMSVKNEEERSAVFLNLLFILKQHVPIDRVAKRVEEEYKKKKILSFLRSPPFGILNKVAAQRPANWKLFTGNFNSSDYSLDEVD